MNYVKGFFVSLLLHGIVAGFIIFGSMNIGAPDGGKQTLDISMIMIDAPDDSGDDEIPYAPPPPPPPPPPVPPKPTPAPEPKPEPQVIKPQPTPDEFTYQNAEPDPDDTAKSDDAGVDEPEDYAEADYGDYDGAYSDSDEAGVIGGVEGGTGDPDAENAGRQAARLGYVRDNYTYIQKRIKDRLVYPSQAKRTGAAGQVTVVFTINEDGTASDIYVEKSSGHAILDTAAVDTVKAASPFRKPPLPAQIAIPIDFKLR